MESSEEQHLFEIEIFGNITNMVTVAFEQFNTSLLNKIKRLIKKIYKITSYWPQTFVKI